MNRRIRAKVGAAGLGGALAVIVVFVLEAAIPGLGIPAEVAAAVASLFSFGAGYLKTE